MVTKAELPAFARKALGLDWLNRPGRILYSSHETLRPGAVYIVGLNPGGDPSTNTNTVDNSINQMLENTENAYLDEIWDDGREAGGAQFQSSVQWFAEQLGVPLRETCASNLVFFQSHDDKGINKADAEHCWAVHEAILKIVQPHLILTLGNGQGASLSAFANFHQKLSGGEIAYTPTDQVDRTLKLFRATANGSPVLVAGLPHPSRNYLIDKPEIKAWLKVLKVIINL